MLLTAFSTGEYPRSFRSNPVDSLKTRPAVEITVEAQNRSNAVTLHNSNVHGGACRQQRRILSDFPTTQNFRFLEGKHFVDEVLQDDLRFGLMRVGSSNQVHPNIWNRRRSTLVPSLDFT